MKKKIGSFWSRAKNKLLAGSNTVLPDLLETNYLIKLIKKNKCFRRRLWQRYIS